MENCHKDLVLKLLQLAEEVSRMQLSTLKFGELFSREEKGDLYSLSFKKERLEGETEIPPHILSYPIFELSVERGGIIAQGGEIEEIHKDILENPSARTSRLIKTIGHDIHDRPYALRETGQLNIFRVSGMGGEYQKVDFRHFFPESGHPYYVAKLHPRAEIVYTKILKLGYDKFLEELEQTREIGKMSETKEIKTEDLDFMKKEFLDLERWAIQKLEHYKG